MQKPATIHKATPRPGDWTDVLAADVLNRYVGKHVAIISKRVVAFGDSYDGVLAESRNLYPDEVPYLVFIPGEEDEPTPAGDVSVPAK